MRELKAGLGLVFGTLWGRLDFILILLVWSFAMIASPTFPLSDFKGSAGGFWILYMMLWPVPLGATQLANGYKNVLSCGGLYCIPRLTKGMKQFSIIAGFVLAFMYTLPWLLIKGMTLHETYISIAISFTLLSTYFISNSTFMPATSKNTLSWLIWLLWMVIFIRLLLALHAGISFLEGWPITLAAGILLCVIYCGHYKDKQIQSAHRQLASSTTDVNERPQQAKLRITPTVERFFIGRLNRCSKKAKYLWGAIYPCLGTLLSRVRQTLLIVLALAIMCGFLPTSSPMIIMFIMIMVISGIGLYIKLPVHSQMLVAGGRRERFYGTIATAIGFSVVIGLIFALIAGISQLIAPIIPPFAVRGQPIVFTPLSLYPAFITMGIIPAIFGLSLCFERAPLLTGFMTIVISISAIFIIFSTEIISLMVKPVPITLIGISCWAFLTLVARSICYEKDLILQTDKI